MTHYTSNITKRMFLNLREAYILLDIFFNKINLNKLMKHNIIKINYQTFFLNYILFDEWQTFLKPHSVCIA